MLPARNREEAPRAEIASLIIIALCLIAWIEQGKLHPEIGHVLPMEQAGEAHRLLLQRANYGKIVLTV